MSQLRPILREYNNANNRRRITFTECENTSYEKSHEKEDTPKKFKDLIQIIPLTEEAGAFRIGPTLVAVNPFINQRMLSPAEFKSQYFLHEEGKISPHVFTITQRAIEGLSHIQKPQILVLSGQSGAGKTFNYNLALEYLSEWTQNTITSEGTQHQKNTPLIDGLHSSSTLLEMLGNARTINNRNSSRFGKFVDLMFTDKKCPSIKSAVIKTFLLEVSRLTSHHKDECNFHIVHAVATHANEVGIRDACIQTRYLRSSAEPFLPKAFSLEQWVSCMQHSGVSKEECDTVIKIISAIIVLGSVDAHKITLSDKPCSKIYKVADLLNVYPNELYSFFKFAHLTCGSEHIAKPRCTEDIVSVVDALARYIYKNAFEAIVTRLNMTLMGLSSADFPEVASNRSIGILDIFGFEKLHSNELEQLCINFVNERLQRHFVHNMVEDELHLYKQEGLPIQQFNVTANQDCLNLLMYHPQSLFRLLDETCRLNRRTQASFTNKCVQILEPKFPDHCCQRSGKQSSLFLIKHYAGEVHYRTDNMPSRNKDMDPAVFKDLLSRARISPSSASQWLFCSTSITTNQIVDSNSSQRCDRRIRSSHGTVTSTFIRDINYLFQNLENSHVHYIRCLASNSREEAYHFDTETVRHQLHASGIVDSLRVFSVGRPIHIPFQDFIEKYKSLLSHDEENLNDHCNQKWIIQNILQKFILDNNSDMPILGRSMVFLKDRHVIALNESVERKLLAQLKLEQDRIAEEKHRLQIEEARENKLQQERAKSNDQQKTQSPHQLVQENSNLQARDDIQNTTMVQIFSTLSASKKPSNDNQSNNRLFPVLRNVHIPNVVVLPSL
eukprot:gene1250-4459_t